MAKSIPSTPLDRSFMEGFKILVSRYINRASHTHGALKIEQILHNRFWEWYYKADTYGIIDVEIPDGQRYEPTPYLIMNEALNRLEMGPNDVYVDLGCGKGRSLVLASQRNLKKVVGVEYDGSLLEVAKANIDKLKAVKPEMEFYCGLAQEYNYDEITRLYLYNSFGPDTLAQVLEVLEASLQRNPRDLRIAYVNPQHDQMLEEAPWLERYDMWEEKYYPAFFVYPPQPKAVTFWKAK